MSENVLRMENVTMQFGGVVAVNNLSIEVNKGEIVALIGPNGAGKTTAFNCVTGVYQPTNGRIEFLGETIVRNHPQGKMAKEYLGEHGTLYTSAYKGEDDPAALEAIAAESDEAKKAALKSEFDKAAAQRVADAKAQDPDALTNRVVAPTPDKITQLASHAPSRTSASSPR